MPAATNGLSAAPNATWRTDAEAKRTAALNRVPTDGVHLPDRSFSKLQGLAHCWAALKSA
jgi:hypothetical protein